MADMITLEDITKKYEHAEVVKNVFMHIKEGEIYGFLGPNGAGKTTIMKMILNLVKPTSGVIRVAGEVILNNSCSYLQNIGSIIEVPVFYNKLNAEKNLRLHCEYTGIYDRKRITDVLELVGLSDCGKKNVGEFSLGMKQRLGLARALVAKPKLLLLDEPINGLDPVGIRQIRDLMVRLKETYGTTILVSSHIISEIEMIADTIGVINDGILMNEVSMEEVRREAVQYLEIHVDDVQKTAMILDRTHPDINFKIISDSGIRIYSEIQFDKISKDLVQAGVGLFHMTYKNDSLEDYFLGMMKGGTAK